LKRFKALEKQIVGVVGNEKAAAEIGIAKSNALARDRLGAGERVKLRGGVKRSGGGASCIAFDVRPETIVENNVTAVHDCHLPLGGQLLHDCGEVILEMLSRRIVAVEFRHALIRRKTKRTGFFGEATSKRGLTCAEKTVDEVDDGHAGRKITGARAEINPTLTQRAGGAGASV
jgi:hypothetical protein